MSTHRLRKREAKEVAGRLKETVGYEVLSGHEIIEIKELKSVKLILINSTPLALEYQGRVFPTVRGLLRWRFYRGWVEVDMGAVPFVCKGADVMVPGIVDVAQGIKKNDLVWIRDTQHKKPLGVGVALISTSQMLSADKGKAVRTIHWVGDKIYKGRG